MTTEEKLQHFYDVSMESAREEAQKALEEYRRALDDMFEEHKKEKEKSAELRLKLETENAKREINKALSAEQLHIKRKLSKKQQELREKIFIDLQAKLEIFRKSSDYPQWLEEKIKEAQNIADSDEIQIYLSKIDENLKEIDNTMTRKEKRACFENAVVENIVTGCTIVMNKKLRDMAKAYPPKFTVMHDWWFYLLASCYGKVYYDKNQYISYRQHGTNTVGYNTSKVKEFKDRVKRFRGNRQNITKQLSEFIRIYKLYKKKEPDNTLFFDDEVKRKTRLAHELVKYSKKVKYIPKRAVILKKTGIYRQRKIDNIIFKIILLSGSY